MYALQDQNEINGFAAELIVSSSQFLKAAKCRALTFPIQTLVKFSFASFQGRRRLAQSQPWLVRNFSQSGYFSWDYVPASEFLDYVLGIDLAVNYLGHRVGIDLMVNRSDTNLARSLIKKEGTHRELIPIYKLMELDKVITLVIQPGFKPGDLRTGLKAAIAQPGLVLS